MYNEGEILQREQNPIESKEAYLVEKGMTEE